MKLKQFLGNDVGYNERLKNEFATEGKRFARAVAKSMPLKQSKIDYNPGGIAVSGDITLMGMFDDNRGVYMTVNTPSTHGILFRSIKNLKDYSGGQNRWLNLEHFSTIEEVATHIQKELLRENL